MISKLALNIWGYSTQCLHLRLRRGGKCILLKIILLSADITTETLWIHCSSDLLQTEVEETLKRIQSHKGVIGTMVVNAEGKYVAGCLPDTQKSTQGFVGRIKP